MGREIIVPVSTNENPFLSCHSGNLLIDALPSCAYFIKCVLFTPCLVAQNLRRNIKNLELDAKFQNRGSRGLKWDSDVIGPNTKVARRTWFQPLRSSYHFATLVEAKNNHSRFREPSNFLANNVRK